ncbi:hypothetical protein [Sorangium sp. So ce1078]|uniref:hypothetical protein n=1 Tax=Sorangium sp. So ce1078 TaxID=3133329 RepID=UPI003F5FA0C5
MGRIGAEEGGQEAEASPLPNDTSVIAAACEANSGNLHVGLTRLRRLRANS